MNVILLLLIFSGVKKETERKNDDLNPTYSEVIISLGWPLVLDSLGKASWKICRLDRVLEKSRNFLGKVIC